MRVYLSSAVCSVLVSVALVPVCALNYSYPQLLNRTVLTECRHFIPQLSTDERKGDRGRIGVFGGSEEYTGAPYFGSMASLRTGADMVYVFCAKNAATPIKSYSPELMVLPCLEFENALEIMKPWLKRIHGLLVGPGLGRNQQVTENIIKLIEYLKCDEKAVPMVLDADAFYIIQANPNLLKGYPNQVYLTPNVVEFKQLASVVLKQDDLNSIDHKEQLRTVAELMGPKVTILLKGKYDRIAHGSMVATAALAGSPRRCGGQGDLLAGCLATLAVWLDMADYWRPAVHMSPEQLAAYGASALLKVANEMAYQKNGRSVIASDILPYIHSAFNTLFED